MPNRTLTFILRRGDRLAARLRHILYAWRFTRQIGAPLLVSWLPRDRSLYSTISPENYGLSLILDLPLFYAQESAREIVFFEGEFDAHKRFTSFPPDDLKSDAPNNLRRDAFEPYRDSTFISESYFLRFADEKKADVQQQVRDLYKMLPVSVAVRRAIDEAQEEIGSDRYAALHVRRGDIVAVLRAAREEFASGRVTSVARNYVIHSAKQTAPLRFYQEAIAQAIAEQLPIVFFSDTPDLFETVQNRFPEARMVDGRLLGTKLRYPLQKAFLDFTLLGSAVKLIATQTGFASFASALGGSEHVNVTARGSWDMYLQFLYDEILEGVKPPQNVRVELEKAAFSEYDRYYKQARKVGVAIA